MGFTFDQRDQCIRYASVDEKIFNKIAEDAKIVTDTIDELSRDAGDAKDDRLSRDHVASIQFDTYNSLLKVNPTRTDGDPLTGEIIDRIMRDEQYPTLRASTVGDDLASVVGSCSLTLEILTKIPPKVQDAANDYRKAEQDAREAENEANAMQILFDEGDDEVGYDDLQEAKDYADLKRQQADAAAQAVKSAITYSSAVITKAVASAVASAQQSAQACSMACTAFGFGNSTVSSVPPEDRIKLAEAIRGQGKRFVDLVNLIGRMQSTAQQKQAAKMHHESGEVVDLTQGDEISLILDDEIALLRHPKFGALQRAKLADADLMQLEVETREPKAKGDIVVLLDESSSMSCNGRDAESKAVTLALASVALKQRRKLIVHFFQHTVTNTVVLDGTDNSAKGMSIAMRGLGAIASRGVAGGTNFDGPLRTAVESSTNLREPDIIIITDGEATVTPDTVKMVESEKKRNGLNVFAMLIGGTQPPETLRMFSDRIWAADSLLGKAASELFELV